MQINLEENYFLFNDIENDHVQNIFKEIFKNIYDKGQLDFNYNSQNNFPMIELEEEKQEESKQFIKAFKEVFNTNKDDFLDEEIDDEEIYFIKPKNKLNKNKKKKGRLKKGSIPDYEVKKNKFDENLIIQKIIRYSCKIAKNHINNTYGETNSEKNSDPLLRSVDAKEYNVYSNQKIYELFNKTLGEIFSADISRRNSIFIKEHSENQNKVVIESLIKDNKEKKVIELLNLTLKEFHGKYINNEIAEYSFENDLNKIEKKEGKDYKDKYEEIALKLINIIEQKGEKIKNK